MTKMVWANRDLHSVKRILGHAQLAATEVYLSLSHEDLKAKHAAASPFEQQACGAPHGPPRGPRKSRAGASG